MSPVEYRYRLAKHSYQVSSISWRILYNENNFPLYGSTLYALKNQKSVLKLPEPALNFGILKITATGATRCISVARPRVKF
jgi:hypothetical protein